MQKFENDSDANLISKKIMDVTANLKYGHYLPKEKRRETFSEIVDRVMEMHLKKYSVIEKIDEKIDEKIKEAFGYVKEGLILCSGRSMQFGGAPIFLDNSRMYNCAYMPILNPNDCRELMHLLLGGTGVGFSVQKHHIDQFPTVKKEWKRKEIYKIPDTREGWAAAVCITMNNYFIDNAVFVQQSFEDIVDKDFLQQPFCYYEMDYSLIRPKGSELKTSGGIAPGPEPLKKTITMIIELLEKIDDGSKIKPIEIYDICCIISQAVLAGGIRRSAMICLFSRSDEEMMRAKSGNFYEKYPYRCYTNNSVVLPRNEITDEEFKILWNRIENSGNGEPGIFWTNNVDVGTNPCVTKRTWIMTNNGPRQVENLIGNKDFKCIVNGKSYKVESNGFFKTGVKEVYGVTLSNGMHVETTMNHPFLTKDNEWVNLENLKIGDSVRISKHDYNIKWDGFGTFNEGWLVGEIYGMGTMDKKEKSAYLNLWGKNKDEMIVLAKEKITTLGIEINKYSETMNGGIECKALYNLCKKAGLNSKKEIIDKIHLTSSEFQKGFLRGLSDRMVNNFQESSNIRIGENNRENLKHIQLMLSHLGMNSTVQKSLNSYTTVPHKSNFIAEITSIIYKGNEEVYDVTVGYVHEFCANGIRLHNCVEISLNAYTFCNLVEINLSKIRNQIHFEDVCAKASFIGTLQAGYTYFPTLHPRWKINTEKDALIGVSMTGIVECAVKDILNYRKASLIIKKVNYDTAKLIGINSAARTNTIKPAGTTSLMLGTTSGIHASFGKYVIRRVTILDIDPITKYLLKFYPELIEKDKWNPSKYYFLLPLASKDHAILQNDETAIQFLNRVKKYNKEWIRQGHNHGDNYNNVSATITIKPHEWHEVGEWMCSNKKYYNGLSYLQYDDTVYDHMPFEITTKKRFDELASNFMYFNLEDVVENEDNTDFLRESGCDGLKCEISPLKKKNLKDNTN